MLRRSVPDNFDLPEVVFLKLTVDFFGSQGKVLPQSKALRLRFASDALRSPDRRVLLRASLGIERGSALRERG